MDFDTLKRLLNALEARGVDYVVFGGIALNLHGLARFTEDLDLFVAPTEDNIASLRRALDDVFADPEINGITADDLLGDYPAVQYVPPDGSMHVDILTRLGEAFRFEDLERVRVPFGDSSVWVVTPRMLHRMKKDTVRLKDRADAELLRERFHLEDEE